MTPRQLTDALLGWYHANARSLPWRDDPTPYHVLLSELMCQQTRVATVLPYYAAFLQRWPTLQDLAAADLDEVLQAWAGLGYYRRARALHACARAATALGGLPSTPEALRALPGIGPYTAGAIASVAFGLRAAAVDGNVERVISRLDVAPEAPWSAAGKRALSARVEQLHQALPEEAHPGDLTQALMELGASLCSVTSPSCGRCPIADGCAARRLSAQAEWPRKRARKPPTSIAAVAGLAWVDGLPVLGRRRGRGLLGGLWEPIRAPIEGGAHPEEALRAAFTEVGLRATVGPVLGTVDHIFSHRRLTLTVHEVAVAGSPVAGGPYDQVRACTPGQVGLSRLADKALALRHAPPLLIAADVSR